MQQGARVNSINALKDFRRALESFGQLAGTALGEAETELRRTLNWIEHDQVSYWQGQKKKRLAKLNEARNELFRAEVAAQDAGARPTLERRNVERAQAAYDEAETKLANIRKWRRVLEREQVLYRGECQSLGRAVEGDVPHALRKLDRMVEALERYVRLPVPESEAEAEP